MSNHYYSGSSSGFSIFSPKGIQWVNEKTGDKSFQQMIMEATSHDMKWSIWRQDVYGPLFEQRGKNRLPSKEVASILVQGETFRTYSSIFCWKFVLMFLCLPRLFPIFQCLLSAFSQTHVRCIV